MNKIAADLFRNDAEFKRDIEQLTRSQFGRRKSAYASESIFDIEDLEQELWAGMFESTADSPDGLRMVAELHAEAIARRGRHKNRKAYGPVEVPISQLPDDQRHAMENVFYGSGSFDE